MIGYGSTITPLLILIVFAGLMLIGLIIIGSARPRASFPDGVAAVEEDFKEKQHPFDSDHEPEYKAVITFTLKNNPDKVLWFNAEKDESVIYVFRDFYKWYHARPQSESYSFAGNSYTSTVLRSEITGFETIIRAVTLGDLMP